MRSDPSPPLPDARSAGAHPAFALGLLLAAAFALRVAVARALPLIEVDGAYWCALAAALERGDLAHGWSAAWPPLEPACVAGMARLLEVAGAERGPATLEWAARLVSSLAGTLVIVPLVALSRRLLSGPAVWIAPLLAAVHPRLVEYSAAALSESLFTFLLVSALAVWPHASPARPRAAAAGALFGTAFLVRPEALPLGAGVWIATAATARARRGRRPSAVLLVALLLVALPWLIHLRRETGEWTLGEKGAYNFWRAHRASYEQVLPAPVALPARVNRSPELAPPARPRDVDVAAFVRARPAAVIATTAANLARLLASSLPVAAAWPVALLAVAALFLPRAGPWWQVLAPLAVAPVLIAPFSADRRFMVPLVPLALPLAACTLDALRRLRPAATPVATGLLALGLLLYALGVPGRADRAPEQRAAGEWLAKAWDGAGVAAVGVAYERRAAAGLKSRPPVVMARKPWVAFYSGGLIADLPNAAPDSILADARRTGVDVLVVDARAARGDRPQLAAWLAPAAAPPGWRLLRRREGADPIALFGPDSAGATATMVPAAAAGPPGRARSATPAVAAQRAGSMR